MNSSVLAPQQQETSSMYDTFLSAIESFEKRHITLLHCLLIELNRLKELYGRRIDIMDLTWHINYVHGECYTSDEIAYVIDLMKWRGLTTVTHGDNVWTTTDEGDILTAELLA